MSIPNQLPPTSGQQRRFEIQIEAQNYLPSNPFFQITHFEARINPPQSLLEEFKIGIQLDIPAFLLPMVRCITTLIQELFQA